MKLTVTIITLNEEKDISRAINSVKEIADEIILVDSGSTDKTVGIAKKLGCRVYYRKFDNYSNQKNFAISKSKSDWILSLDADEEIDRSLSQEIKESIESVDFNGFYIDRRNFILGKEIKFTRWQKQLDSHIWLWKKGKGTWIGDVHEEIKLDGNVGKLLNAKIHYQYETVSEFLEMLNKYSTLEAKNKTFSWFNFMFQPIYNFLVRYFYRLGFLDGWRGFILSFLMAFYHLELQTKIWVNSKSINT